MDNVKNSLDDIVESSSYRWQGGGFDSRPFDKEEWAERKQAERQAVYALADTAAEAVRDGGKFQEYLDVQARFDRYSATNVLLILAQKPGATQIKDYDGWREAGASIRRREKGISILEPGREYERDNGSIGVTYNVKKVFDISQTTAKIRKEPAVSVDERLLIKALIHRPPVPIRMEDTLAGSRGAAYDYGERIIFVRRGLEAADLFRCVSLALAHAEIASQREDYSYEEADFAACGVSYLLCKKYGIDTGGCQFAELPAELRESDAREIREALNEIRDVADRISGRMYRILEQDSKGRNSKSQNPREQGGR